MTKNKDARRNACKHDFFVAIVRKSLVQAFLQALSFQKLLYAAQDSQAYQQLTISCIAVQTDIFKFDLAITSQVHIQGVPA